MKSGITLIGLLIACSVSLARPFPSSGYNIKCTLNVFDVSKFTDCSYGPSCPVNRAQASVRFETLNGSLEEPLSGFVSVKEIVGYHEANGGPISDETQALVKLMQTAELQLKINYIKPSFLANLWSASDPRYFNLTINETIDLSKGTRHNGPISDLVKLKSNDSVEGGIYGKLSCSPDREIN